MPRPKNDLAVLKVRVLLILGVSRMGQQRMTRTINTDYDDTEGGTGTIYKSDGLAEAFDTFTRVSNY